MMKIKNKKFKAFTLVELIIVITILAILATIAFVSFQWYIKNSRDSSRVWSLNGIKKWLELFLVQTWNIPAVEKNTGTGVIDGVIINKVWVFWENASQLIHLKWDAVDPLTRNQFVYGTNNTHTQYQISTIVESQITWFPLISWVYADAWSYKAKVEGNYSWYVRFSTGGSNYLTNIPWLIYTNTGTVTLLSTNTYFIVDKKNNLPYSIDTLTTLSNTPWSQIIKETTNNPNAILTGVNITNITAANIQDTFSWNILASFWWNIEVIKSAVLWVPISSPITPATCNIWEDGSSWVCKDPYWSNVVLALHWEQIADTTGKNTLSTQWNTRLDAVRSKFWGSSLYFDGVGDTILIPDSANFDFWVADFTIETWVNTDARGGYDRIIAGWNQTDGSFNQWFLWAWPATQLNFWYWNWSYIEVAPGVPSWPNNEWHYVTVTRQGTNVYIFWDWILRHTWNMWAWVSINTWSYWVSLWGRYHNWGLIEFFHGNIDELRITKWVARYTTNFTPPTQAFAHQ